MRDFCGAVDWTWPFAADLRFPIIYCSQRFNSSNFVLQEFDRAQINFPQTLRKAVPKRQAEFLAGRICARNALAALGYSEVVPGVNDDRSPQWPAGVVGAITHDSNMAAVVVAQSTHCAGLGLDTEQISAVALAPDIVADVLTAPELEVFYSLEDSAHAKYLALAFSLKESLFKALYPSVGRYFDFQYAQVVDIDAENGHAELILRQRLDEHWGVGYRFSGHYVVDNDRVTTLIALPK